MRVRFILIALLLLTFAAQAQNLPIGTVYGKVIDENGHPIEMANVVVLDMLVGQTTNAKGYYELTMLSDTTLTLHFSFVGYEQKQVSKSQPPYKTQIHSSNALSRTHIPTDCRQS